MIKIGYMGWLKKQNLGDEAVYIAVRDLLKKHLKKKYTLIAKSRHPEKAVYDYFICGGGTILSPWATRWDTYLDLMYKKGAKCFIFGSGVQPFGYVWPGKTKLTKKTKELLKSNIERSELASVRTIESKKTCVKVGCRPGKIGVIGDPALACSAKGGKELVKLRTKKKIIGISMGTAYGNMLGRDEESMKNAVIGFARTVLMAGKYAVVFFPMWKEDLRVQKEIVKAVGGKDVFSVNKISNVASTLKLISKLDYVVGMKLHSSVFAAAMGVPFISLAYRPKCTEFANSVGMKKYAIGTDKLSYRVLIKRFNELVKAKSRVERVLKKKKAGYIRKMNLFAAKVASKIS
jgi:polysaccharide pyruvyl transferase WcaK-like protein